MFSQSFHERTAKHLNVFQRAVDGLKQVQQDINTAIGQRNQEKDELAATIKNHDKEIIAMAKHADAIGDTISKINVLLPAVKVQQNMG